MMTLGYGLGSLGLGSTYYFMSAYFVVFLTNCVGLNPATATSISALALMVEVVYGMAVGSFSDVCTSKMGRRKPFLCVSAAAMLPIIILVTRTIDAPVFVKICYYLTFAVLFRVFFSNYEIPYNALGAEIVTDYDKRTRLRTISRLFSIAGNAVGYIMPLVILDLFSGNEKDGWQAMGIILGIICAISWTGNILLVKESQIKDSTTKTKNIFKHIASSYYELLHLKAMKLLVLYKAAFSCAFALNNVGTIYFLQYNLGLDNRYSSYIYVFTIVIFITATPLVDKMAMVRNKAWQQMVTMALCGVSGILIFFLASGSVVWCAVYVGLLAFVTTGFWQLSSSIFYDIVEVDEFVNGKRREGDITSLVSVLGTLITAAMVQLFGIFFEISGFNPSLSIQPESVLSFLNASFILMPALCLIIGAVVLKLFPINRENFAALRTAIELKKNDEDYSMYEEKIEMIIR